MERHSTIGRAIEPQRPGGEIVRRVLVAAILVPLFGVASTAGAASLCLQQDGKCVVPGGRFSVRVVVDPDGAAVAGAQVSVDYDVTAATLLSVTPGSVCDVASPFSQQLFLDVDENAGEIHLAVGLAPGGSATTDVVTVACLNFAARSGHDAADLCVNVADGASLLVDGAGAPIPIVNDKVCPATGTPPVSCRAVAFDGTCSCSPDCGWLDSTCAAGACTTGGGDRCVAAPLADGTSCDDGFACTSNESCKGGVCVGTDCDAPSLCLEGDNVCQFDGTALVRVVMGDSTSPVFGAQLVFDYSPNEIEILEVLPGAACDPTSPFELEIDTENDPDTGHLFAAVGVDFNHGVRGATDSTTVACLRVTTPSLAPGELCLVPGENPQATILSSGVGQTIPIYNAPSCPSGTADALSCLDVSIDTDCTCEADGVDCAVFGTACREAYCDDLTGHCRTRSINEGGPCDDGAACTQNDRCILGTCRGFGCDHPSLCVNGPGCVGPGLPRRVEVTLGEGGQSIAGGQFLLRYDPAVLEFLDISPGSACDPDSPFALELFFSLDESKGEIFYAVGIEPAGAPTTGPAVMACLRFVALKPDAGDVCVLQGTNPFRTLIVDNQGNSVEPYNQLACPTGTTGNEISCDDICTVPAMTSWAMTILVLLLLTGSKVTRFGARG